MAKFLFTFSIFIVFVSSSESTEFKFFGMNQVWLAYEKTEPVANHPGTPEENWGIRIRRAIVGVKAVINEIFSYSFHLEFAYKDSPALDIFLNAAIDKYFNIRLGQFIPDAQTKEGTIVPTDLMFYEYSDIALKMASYSGFSALRDVGLQFYGGDDLFRYSAYIGNGTGRFNYNNASQYIKNRKFGNGFYGARFDFFPTGKIRIGGHLGCNIQDSVRLDDKVLSYDRFFYSLGISFSDFLIDNTFGEFEIAEGKAYDKAKDTTSFNFNGLYATLGYKITREFHLLCRYELYGENPSSGNDILYKKLNIGACWYFFNESTDLLKLALNYQLMKEKPVDFNNNIFVLLVQAKF
jgi:hypothetical protein